MVSSLSNFKLAWKTATLLAFVTAKHCSDNQHLLLQYHVLILFWHMVVRWIHQVTFHLRFILNLTLMIIFALSFTLRFTFTILSSLGRSHTHLMCALCSGVTTGLYVPCMCYTDFLLGKTSFRCCCVHGFCSCPSCRQTTGPEFLSQPDIIFLLKFLLEISTGITFSMVCWASLSSQVVGVKQDMIDHGSPQY